MTDQAKPEQPAPGQSTKYMGRTLTRDVDGSIKSEMPGRMPLVHPNWTRAMDAINLTTGINL